MYHSIWCVSCVSCDIGVLYGVCGCGWSFKVSVLSDVRMCRVSLSVTDVGVFMIGLWCPRIRGGVVEGAQGDGGFMRNMPDRGGVR